MSDMSPFQSANSWLDLYCFRDARRFRRFLMWVTVGASALGALISTGAGTAVAWRAAGFPTLASEAFVQHYVGEQIAPLAKTVIALDSRSNDMFTMQQVVLTKVSDPTANTALAAQIAIIMAAQKRIETKLGNIEKPAHRVSDRALTSLR